MDMDIDFFKTLRRQNIGDCNQIGLAALTLFAQKNRLRKC
jgi:hypothetical protein